MRIEIGRKIEKYIKAIFHKLFINKDDFTIIANNCWGTFVYKKFGLEYRTPFVNLMMFAPDYIDLVENFSFELLQKIDFIEHEDSKFKDELIRLGIFDGVYPIGVLDGKYELHFMHYLTKEDAREKWFRRLTRINPKKMIFKFSDGDLFEPEMAKRFDELPYKNKVFFTAKEFPELKSAITLEKFKGKQRVHDEWKNANKEFNMAHFFNNIVENESIFL